jgi:phthalate 3,4-dioxygenase ferredoxin reductase component
MTPDSRTGVVVVGASVAGVNCARALRSQGYAGRILLVGEEPEVPYDKPPLSKELLAGKRSEDDIRLISAEAAAETDIELLVGQCAVRLDVAEQIVELSDHPPVPFDRLVIATGARARPAPWPAESGVHLLRTLGDARALRSDLERGGPLVVVGAGFIGAEVAATARHLGLDVTVVDPVPVPLGRIVGDMVGQLLVDLHEDRGVATRFGVGVENISGRQGALRVQLTTGEMLEAATVVVGIGVIPNDDWLADSGLAVDGGVLCDEYCRAIGGRGAVFAAGDVARWFRPERGAHSRVEHWTNAVEQAQCVAHNITHPQDLRPFEPAGYVWSDQYDWKIQIAGDPAGAEEQVVIGDVTTGPFAVLYGTGRGSLQGALTVNWPRAMVDCRRALLRRAGLDAAAHAIRARGAGAAGHTRPLGGAAAT